MRANEWSEFLPILRDWHIWLLVPGIDSGENNDFQEMLRAGFALEKTPEGLLIKGPTNKRDLPVRLARHIALRKKIVDLRSDIGRCEAELAETGG